MVELETSVEPTWPKLVEPLEKIIDRLSVVWGIVNHLNTVKDSPQLRSAIQQVQVRASLFLNFLLEDAMHGVIDPVSVKQLINCHKELKTKIVLPDMTI